MIKVVISSLATMLLTACVTYYPYPYEGSANVTYIDDSVAYDDGGVEYVEYGSSPYYPWGSIDYFYLGNHYYQTSGSVSFSFGMGFGAPWYYPYYGGYYYPYYYSAWYSPFYYPYPYYGWGGWYGWQSPYWNQHHYGHAYQPPYGGHGGGHGRGDQDGQGYGQPGRPLDNHAATPRAGEGSYGHTIDQATRSQEAMRRGGDTNSQTQPRSQPRPSDRHVTVAPSTGGPDRGMTVINSGENKIRNSRTEPVQAPGRGGRATQTAPATAPDSTARQAQMRMPRPNASTGIPMPARSGHNSAPARPAGYANSAPGPMTMQAQPAAPVSGPRTIAPAQARPEPRPERNEAPPSDARGPDGRQDQGRGGRGGGDGDYGRGDRDYGRGQERD